jgi:hypothetical protein
MIYSQTGLWISGANCPHLIPKTSHCLIRYTGFLPDYYRITGLDQLHPPRLVMADPKPMEYGSTYTLPGV